MNEKPPYEKSMIGRAVDAEGKDLGDKKFFERDMGFTPEAESKDLDRLEVEDAATSVRQVELIAERDPVLGQKAYQQLIAMYPDHPSAADWQTKLDALTAQK